MDWKKEMFIHLQATVQAWPMIAGVREIFYRCQSGLDGNRSRFEPCTFRTLPINQDNLSSVISRLFHKIYLIFVYGAATTEFWSSFLGHSHTYEVRANKRPSFAFKRLNTAQSALKLSPTKLCQWIHSEADQLPVSFTTWRKHHSAWHLVTSQSHCRKSHNMATFCDAMTSAFNASVSEVPHLTHPTLVAQVSGDCSCFNKQFTCFLHWIKKISCGG